MPRESAASQAVARIRPDNRLDPPPMLTEAEHCTWMAIVNARPAEWFGEEHVPLLTQLCRHRVQADVVASQIASLPDPGDEPPEDMSQAEYIVMISRALDRLLKMQERESRAITALMRSMRMTQQSLIRAEKVVPPESAGGGRKPWDA